MEKYWSPSGKISVNYLHAENIPWSRHSANLHSSHFASDADVGDDQQKGHAQAHRQADNQRVSQGDVVRLVARPPGPPVVPKEQGEGADACVHPRRADQGTCTPTGHQLRVSKAVQDRDIPAKTNIDVVKIIGEKFAVSHLFFLYSDILDPLKFLL